MSTHSRKVSRESCTSRRSLPLTNDPVITYALETSIAQSRASSLHNLPLESFEKEERSGHPFRRWLSVLHRRSVKRKNSVLPRKQRWSLNEFDDDPPSPCSSRLFPKGPLRHRKSSSWNSGSTALIAGTRSAFASVSILSDNPHATFDGSYLRLPRSRRSERESSSIDIDSGAVGERRAKRRKVIEEIFNSESEYLLSLRALDNLYKSVCVTAAEPLRSDMIHMQSIIGQLTDLHHELGGALHKIRGPGKNFAEPREAAEVAMVFGQQLDRFLLYEEYGSKYEEMLHNVGLASKSMSDWHSYQRGFEMLSNSISPVDLNSLRGKKSLTFGDLHIKPIQRVCKYPLLFADLCKCTPIIDGPDEHLELEKILFRFRDTVIEINRATSDSKARERMQRSWKLQDMLVFPDPLLAPHILRSLGHAKVCGALYIAYQSSKGVHGEYMLCTLFKSYLILAVPFKRENVRKYRVVVSIALANMSLHSSDSEFGLHCLTAPYAWKILFEVDSTIFELLAVATSASDQERWIQTIRDNAKNEKTVHEQFSMLSLNVKSIGSVMGKPGSLLRSMAMKGTQAAKRQVVIRGATTDVSNSIHLTMRERIILPVLAPRKTDRGRIEEDIETASCREIDRGSGSQTTRILRSSASTLMRKLSRSSKKTIDK